MRVRRDSMPGDEKTSDDIIMTNHDIALSNAEMNKTVVVMPPIHHRDNSLRHSEQQKKYQSP